MNPQTLSTRVGEALLARGWQLATAESCTGGAIAASITDIAGSSQWFDRGFVTYSNQAKQDMLGVRAATLEAAGAVSEATVIEMAEGALAKTRAQNEVGNGAGNGTESRTESGVQISVAVSGIAGPGGGSADKPVGTVCLAWAMKDAPTVVCTEHFAGDRAAVRAQTVLRALQGVLDILACSDTSADTRADAGS